MRQLPAQIREAEIANQMLTVRYDASTVTPDGIRQALNQAGYESSPTQSAE